MKECFKKLEARQTFNRTQTKAVADSAKQFRLFRATYLSELKAEFDPEYREFLENLNRQAKTK